MADDFKALVAAQKETTRLLMTAEERAVSDKDEEKARDARSESARKGWETRQENLALQNQSTDQNTSENLQEIGESSNESGEALQEIGDDTDKSGAASEEDATKEEGKDNKILGYLKQTAGFLGGIAKQGMEKVKSGLQGFSKFLFGALALAALAFLDHPKFKAMVSLLIDTLIPLAVTFYEEVLVPVGAALAKLFKDIMGYLKDGKPSLMSILMDNKLAILGIITALAPNLVFGALKLAVTGLVKGVVLLSKSKVFLALKTQFALMKTALFAKLASLKAALVPLLPIIAIAAGIALVIVSLKKAFDDFKFELEATGSIWEATKTAIVSVISNILGLPFDLLKDGVSWILGKIGSVFGLESFTNASKALDDFSFVDSFKDMLTFLGDSISGIFDGFMQSIQDLLRSPKLKFLGGGFAADALFGTKEEQVEKKKAKEEEQKQFELNRKALREKQKLEKATEEAKKLEKIKAEKNALAPKAPAMNPIIASRMGMGASAGANIVSAPTSVVTSNSSSNTTTSTPVRQPNRVIGQLASAY